ncbi:hypothetical protein ARSEF4850_010173, partial [Beauveria asiatica]
MPPSVNSRRPLRVGCLRSVGIEREGIVRKRRGIVRSGVLVRIQCIVLELHTRVTVDIKSTAVVRHGLDAYTKSASSFFSR